MPILNPTPIKASTFDGMWISMLNVSISAERPHMVLARLQPWDGTNLLLNGGRSVRTAPPEGLAKLINAEVARLAGNESGVMMLSVSAPDPAKPVKAVARFASGQPFLIHDVFELAATDAVFAAALAQIMGSVAALAGLPVEP